MHALRDDDIPRWFVFHEDTICLDHQGSTIDLQRELPEELPGELPRELPRELPGDLPGELPIDLPNWFVFHEDAICLPPQGKCSRFCAPGHHEHRTDIETLSKETLSKTTLSKENLSKSENDDDQNKDTGLDKEDINEDEDDEEDGWLRKNVTESQRTTAYIKQMWGAKGDHMDMHRSFVCSQMKWCETAIDAYQNHGVQWMMLREWLIDLSLKEQVRGGVLADDAGLGKTFQVIRLIMGDFAWGLYLGRSDVRHKRTLIVTPKSVLTQWESEFRKFKCSTAYWDVREFVLKIEAVTDPPAMLPDHVGVVIVPYSAFRIPRQANRSKKKAGLFFGGVPAVLKNTCWNRIVLDEGHEIRNASTLVHKQLCGLQARCRWVISATPMQNSVNDLRALASFIGIQDTTDVPFIRENYILRRLGEVEKHIAAKHGRGGAHASMLSRMPDVQCIVQRLDFQNDAERAVYNRIKARMDALACVLESNKRARAEKSSRTGSVGKALRKPTDTIIRYIMFLRQVCVDARIFVEGEISRAARKTSTQKTSKRRRTSSVEDEDDDEDDDDDDDDDDDGEDDDAGEDDDSENDDSGDDRNVVGPPTDIELNDDGEQDDSLAATVLARCGITKMSYTAFSNQMSTKVAWLVKQLVQMHAQNAVLKPSPALRDRAVVFCEWHNEMNLIAMALKRCNVRPLLYHGGMSLQERDATLHKFGMTLHPLAEDVLLIQIRSGSEGLNLQMANRIYIMSPTWNPCIEAQAIGRVVRLGQGCERNVVITRLVMSGTVEERCLEIQERKKALVQKAMRDNSLAMKLGAALTKADIQAIIGTQADS